MPSDRLKILVFIDHDAIIRHFIATGAFKALRRRHEVVFVFPPTGHRRIATDLSSLDLGSNVRFLAPDDFRIGLWATLFRVDRLRWRLARHYRVQRKFLCGIIEPEQLAKLKRLALPVLFSRFKRRTIDTLAKNPNKQLDRLLDDERPDILIHPTVLGGLYINDLSEAAQRRNLPLIAIMNSWDNPSTKQTLVVKPSWLFVWGEQTRAHAIRFAGMQPERVVSFGAAQFETYRKKPSLSRDEFLARNKIEPGKQVLLYAGSSTGTSEIEHLRLLDAAAEQGLLGNVAILYRPHPWGAGGKDGAAILDQPWRHVRFEHSMLPYLENIRQGGHHASFPDYGATRDVLSHVDAVLAPLSTILLEAALVGKPSLCYLPIDEQEATFFQGIYRLTHFVELFNNPVFLMAKGRENLVPGAIRLMSHVGDLEFSKRLMEGCRFFVESFEQPFDERLAQAAESICAGLRPC